MFFKFKKDDIRRVLNRASRKAVEPIVVVLRVDTTRVEIQFPAIRLRVKRGSPVVAVAATVVPRRAVAVA